MVRSKFPFMEANASLFGEIQSICILIGPCGSQRLAQFLISVVSYSRWLPVFITHRAMYIKHRIIILCIKICLYNIMLIHAYHHKVTIIICLNIVYHIISPCTINISNVCIVTSNIKT